MWSLITGHLPHFHRSGVPRLWVPSKCISQARGGYKDVQHGNNESSPSFAWFHSGDDSSEQTFSRNVRSIRPGTAVPSTVLVSDMGDGSLLLEGWRDGPSAYLSPADAMPFRRQLAAAFRSPDVTLSGGQGRAR